VGGRNAGRKRAAEAELIARLAARVRDVPDFPRPGILFKDITPLLSDPASFVSVVDLLAARVASFAPHGIVAIESRGFVFGAALAYRLRISLELVRKPGKLPYRTVGAEYALEYGSDRLEVHVDAIQPGRSYLVVDDLIATGGTAAAVAELVEQQGGHVAGFAFVIELAFLRGRERLGDRPVVRLIEY
jgi:adenine phosphoribosyltransferase